MRTILNAIIGAVVTAVAAVALTVPAQAATPGPAAAPVQQWDRTGRGVQILDHADISVLDGLYLLNGSLNRGLVEHTR